MLSARKNQLILFLIFLDSLSFMADLSLHKGWAVWVLYLIPAVLALFSSTALAPLVQAGVAILLTWIAYLAAPSPDIPAIMVIANRAMGSVAFLCTGVFGRFFVQRKLRSKNSIGYGLDRTSFMNISVGIKKTMSSPNRY